VLYVSIALVLGIFWFVLSGHYTVLTLTAGVISVAGTVALARRMQIVDEEGHPIRLLPRAATYWPWLAKEIVKAAWDVTKIVLNPRLPISPTLVRVRASQRTAVGITTYANSITLTPGTITARVSGNEFLVHAITRAGAEELAEGTMDRRVKKFEAGE
jgi:multicomponent Na+:H+ antiporter subunit E